MKNLQKHREKACKIRGYSYISRCKKGKEKKKSRGNSLVVQWLSGLYLKSLMLYGTTKFKKKIKKLKKPN